MIAAVLCLLVVALTFRVRRDLTGPEPTSRTELVFWAGFVFLGIWLLGDWFSGDRSRWFDSELGAGLLAAAQAACVLAMGADTAATIKMRSRDRRRPPPP